MSLNNRVVFYSGYYGDSESGIFCVDPSDISYCITPNYCNNGGNLTYSDSIPTISNHPSFIGSDIEDTTDLIELNVVSYKSITNKTSLFYQIDDGFSKQQIIYCRGEQSCTGSNIGVVFVVCSGAFSCDSTTFKHAVGDSGYWSKKNYIYCFGTGSCTDTYSWFIATVRNSRGLRVRGVGAMAFKSSFDIKHLGDITNLVVIDIDTSLGAIDADINVNTNLTLTDDEDYEQSWFIEGYYVLFNVSINCYNATTWQIGCTGTGPHIFGTIDSSCDYVHIISAYQSCNIISSIEEMNAYDTGSYEMITEIRDLISLSQEYSDECDQEYSYSDNYNLVQDIGYPLSATLEIANDVQYGLLCCRGYESCAYTTSIYANLGSILCSGEQSCYQSDLIWTGEESNDNYNNDKSKQASILCTGTQACSESTMDATYHIVCLGFHSCSNSLIFGGLKLYCTKHSCTGAFIRQTQTVYLIDNNTDTNIYR